MQVQISSNSYLYKKQLNISKKTTFKANFPIETIKNYNIGIMKNGYIGKVKVLKFNGEVVFLNVFKNATPLYEEYKLLDNLNRVIGKIELKQNKYNIIDELQQDQSSNHIFVNELKNYSKPNTPYYIRDLEEYRWVGIRLLQIAQRRSDECSCNGNIELVSKGEAIKFYEKLGFKRFPLVSKFLNPNKMYLPAEAKEPFSKLYGGL